MATFGFSHTSWVEPGDEVRYIMHTHTHLSVFAVPRLSGLNRRKGVLPEGNGQSSLRHQLTNELHQSRLTKWTSQQGEDLSTRVDGDKGLE